MDLMHWPADPHAAATESRPCTLLYICLLRNYLAGKAADEYTLLYQELKVKAEKLEMELERWLGGSGEAY